MKDTQSHPASPHEANAYAEAQRLIQECRENGETKLDLTFFPELKAIPPEIMEVQGLEELDLSGLELDEIPAFIGAIASLEKLSVGMGCYCTWRQHIKTRLPEELANLPHLRALSLGCHLSDIPDWVWTLDNLKELSLSFDDEIKAVPQAVSHMKNLRALHIRGNGINALPDSLGNLASLRELRVESDSLIALPPSFCQLERLEELHLDTFRLMEVPDVFDTMTYLKNIDIFSGHLFDLPETMGLLQVLESLRIDAPQVKIIPESFANLSYLKKEYRVNRRPTEEELFIDACLIDPIGERRREKKRHDVLDALSAMESTRYREKYLGTFPLKKLESLIGYYVSAPQYEDWGLFEQLFQARSALLNRSFRWSDENIQRIANASRAFDAAWEEGFAKVKIILDALYENEADKDSFAGKYEVEIILRPLHPAAWRNAHYVSLQGYGDVGMVLRRTVEYDPTTKNEDTFWKGAYLLRLGTSRPPLSAPLNYAINELYAHHNWAFEDIAEITDISTEIKVAYKT